MAAYPLIGVSGSIDAEETRHFILRDYLTAVIAAGGVPVLLSPDMEGDMLEGSYPGLADVATKQLIAKAPMISAVVNEIVLAECGTEEDAATAASILQDRVDAQAEGGAWYPESMEAWGRGQVIQEGTYVAMIASAEHQEEIADAFEGLFA